MKIEGYWRQTENEVSDLPFPVKSVEIWNKELFLMKLREKETLAHDHAYRGFSTCRICNKINGSHEYELDGWRWPDGFIHYVEEHDVRPTKEFENFIISE